MQFKIYIKENWDNDIIIERANIWNEVLCQVNLHTLQVLEIIQATPEDKQLMLEELVKKNT